MKSLLYLCRSDRLSIHPSLNFLKIGSLIFSDILHDDIWLWYLVTDEARFGKKIGGPNLGPMGLNQFGSYVFLEIEYDGSLQQCLTSSRAKTCEKSFGAQI